MSETTMGAGFSTVAIHAGAPRDPATPTRLDLAEQAASLAFDGAERAGALHQLQAFDETSSRLATAVLEERVAALEGGTAALAVASSQAARMLAFQTLLQPGDEFVAARRLSGRSIDPFEHAFKSFGWTVRWADPAKPESFVEALSDRTKAIFVESLADPGGRVSDIEAVAVIARRARVPLIVDNTLATPYLVRPFEHGADLIVQSTRLLGGHGGVRGGLIVDGGSFSFAGDGRYPLLSRPSPASGGMAIAETFGNFAFAEGVRALGLRDIGATLSPFDAFLILSGIETLALRMQRHCDNALAVACYLETHPRVGRVLYAGLETDPGYWLAQRYSPKGAGAVLAFDVGGRDAGLTLLSRLRLFSQVADAGGARSLVVAPTSAKQRRPHAEATRANGADFGLVSVFIGLEDVADIIADLDQALAA